MSAGTPTRTAAHGPGGKVWFITGVSRGFGKALAQILLAEGATVIGTTRSDASPLAPDRGTLHLLPLELTDPAAIVPLRGPGNWTLAVDHAVVASLLCGTRSDPVSLAVRITSNQRCLLDINIATGAPTTWILRAAP